MKILVAANTPISLAPFRYMAAKLSEKGFQADFILYPHRRENSLAARFYAKLEAIYLQRIQNEIDTAFSRHKQDCPCELSIKPSLDNSEYYDYVISLCDFMPDEIRQIKSEHKWYASTNCQPGHYGIKTAHYVTGSIGVTPLYIIEVQNKEIIYFSESLTHFPLAIRNDFLILCKAVNIIIRYVCYSRPIQNNSLAYQPVSIANYKSNVSLKSIACHLIKAIRWKLTNAVFNEQWHLLISENHEQLPPNLDLFTNIKPPDDRFWADPCLIEYNSKNYIFVEELKYNNRKGVIRCMPFTNPAGIEEGKVIIEEPYHLSFPFVFEYLNDYYMLIEASQNKTIDLYKCLEFPYTWTKHKNIMMDIKAVDSTICYSYNKWWLFTNIAPGPGTSCNDELHIFYTDDPVNGEWISHPLNPVVEGAGFCRNAGKLFEHHGKLYRPSQICVGRYGAGININEVVKLNVSQYEERCVHRITPSGKNRFSKMHTMDWGRKYLVLDGAIMLRK